MSNEDSLTLPDQGEDRGIEIRPPGREIGEDGSFEFVLNGT